MRRGDGFASEGNAAGRCQLRTLKDFDGYVEFFLLQDLVDNDGTIRFFHPFDNFRTPAIPKTAEEYLEYLRRSRDSIRARSDRIDAQP